MAQAFLKQAYDVLPVWIKPPETQKQQKTADKIPFPAWLHQCVGRIESNEYKYFDNTQYL